MKEKRSFQATFVEMIMRIMYSKPRETEEQLRADKTIQPEVNDISYVMPKGVHFKDCKEQKLKNMQVFTFNTTSKKKLLVFYIHGGGYVHQPTIYHWRFIKKLIEQADCKVVFPIYPKAPVHQFEESYDLLIELYQSILRDFPDHKIIFMGDSAGGGLAMGLAMELAKVGISLPESYVLSSPWVDVTMTNPEAKRYAKADPILSIPQLRVWGQMWAGDTDLTDPRISPLYGDLGIFKNILLFTGTREVFYPDEVLLAEKLKKSGGNVKLQIGWGMNHEFPTLPIPEANQAIITIAQFIDGK